MTRKRIIRLDRPATNWNDALPIGNGRLGGMIHGGVDLDHIQLNEDTLWSGGPRDRNNSDALSQLPRVRELLLHGEIEKAEQLSLAALCGQPECQRHYESLADLFVSQGFGESPAVPIRTFGIDGAVPDTYSREIDLSTAVASTGFVIGGIEYRREYFASAPNGAIGIRFTASAGGMLFVRARLRRLGALTPGGRPVHNTHFVEKVKSIMPETDASGVVLTGATSGDGGIRFGCGVRWVVVGGTCEVIGGILHVDAADTVDMFVTGVTNFHDPQADIPKMIATRLEDCVQIGYDRMRRRHMEDYRHLFDRATVDIEGPDLSHLPVSDRLDAVRNGVSDVGLEQLYFDFGRYLLISSSRPGGLPANLQGIWNDQILPPWDSKYTVNINTQMNYWPAEICNLTELHEPLFDLLERVAVNGRETAARMYGARGYCLHHNTDIWADTAPQGESIPATFWALAHLWFAIHVWDHYLYSGDSRFLEEHFGLIRGAVEFVLDFLIDDGTGTFVTAPSASPENSYLLGNGAKVALCVSPSFDTQLIREVFQIARLAEAVLGIEDGVAGDCEEMETRLPEIEIGDDGRILEWRTDVPEAEPGHRHLSHLFGLFPGTLFDSEETPDLFRAARRSLEHRLEHGGGRTGWSRAWVINLFAALGDGDEAREHLLHLLRLSTHLNLLDLHPPFQIDGNLGGVSGVAHMLLQSKWDGIGVPVVKVFPALPGAWASGSFRGLRARGGLTVSATWRDGVFERIEVVSEHGGRCNVSVEDKVYELDIRPGEVGAIGMQTRHEIRTFHDDE